MTYKIKEIKEVKVKYNGKMLTFNELAEKKGAAPYRVSPAFRAGFRKLSAQEQDEYRELLKKERVYKNKAGALSAKNRTAPELTELKKKAQVGIYKTKTALEKKMEGLQTEQELTAETKKHRNLIQTFIELTQKELAARDKEIRELKEAARIPETKAKVSRHFLSAQSAHGGTFESKQLELWKDDFELDQDQNKYNLDKQLKGYIKDFRGLRLTYWQEKFVTACYCIIDKQKAHAKNPFILLESWADLYKEVLEKKDGGYGGKERELLIQGGKELQTQLQQMAFYKTTTKGKGEKEKNTRKYFITEGPLITNIGYYGETAETKNALQDIKNKGKMAISFNLIIFEGLVDRWRLIPKNLTREIKEACPEITRAKITAERFIKWLHTHGIGKIEIRRSRDELIKGLDLKKSYKKNKDRTIKKLLECYDIAKKTGYLTNYKLNQKGTIKLLDVFYLNQDKFEHLKTKKVEKEPDKQITEDLKT